MSNDEKRCQTTELNLLTRQHIKTQKSEQKCYTCSSTIRQRKRMAKAIAIPHRIEPYGVNLSK